MKYIKINDFWNQFNQPDYKNLDINKVIPGSQLYFDTYFVCATNEELDTLPADVAEITADDYMTEKQTKQDQKEQQSNSNEVLAQTVANLTLQNADLTNQIETLSQTVAQMQLG